MWLSSLLLISAVAGKCRVDYVERSPSCDTKKLGMDFYAIGALHYLTPMKFRGSAKRSDKFFHISVAVWGNIFHGNLCEGAGVTWHAARILRIFQTPAFKLTVQVVQGPERGWSNPLVMAWPCNYFYSYNEKDGKIHENIEACDFVHGICCLGTVFRRQRLVEERAQEGWADKVQFCVLACHKMIAKDKLGYRWISYVFAAWVDFRLRSVIIWPGPQLCKLRVSLFVDGCELSKLAKRLGWKMRV